LAIQDSLIVDQLKRESTLGVSNLVTKYQGFLYRWGRWHFEAINDQDLIQIVEDTFMRVIENTFDNNPADGNNRAYNAVQLELDKKIFYDYLSPNTKEHPLAQKVRDFMEGLDENSRIILYACADGFPYREIANWVGMPVEHIKVYYSRLKKKLEKYLIETEGM